MAAISLMHVPHVRPDHHDQIQDDQQQDQQDDYQVQKYQHHSGLAQNKNITTRTVLESLLYIYEKSN